MAHSHSHDHDHSHGGSESEDPTLLGVIHIIASPTADLHDVEHRVSHYFKARKMDVIVHVEREGGGKCWCGGRTSSKVA